MRTKRLNIAITIFLAVAVIVLTIVLTVIIKWYYELGEQFEMVAADADRIMQDNNQLLKDNLDLMRQIETLDRETTKLFETLETVREINKELMNKQLEQQTEEPAEHSKERLPEGHTNTFRCEDYRKINLQGSEHIALQQVCETEQKTGLRYYETEGERYYCAALAGAYGSTIGDTWRVTLKCGTVFNIIFADYKHPDQINNADPNDFGDPDQNYDEQPTTSVIEFVYDWQAAPQEMIDAGTMSYFEQFGGLYGDGGDIVEMKYIGRKWEP